MTEDGEQASQNAGSELEGPQGLEQLHGYSQPAVTVRDPRTAHSTQTTVETGIP